jgi:hypothetical protein
MRPGVRIDLLHRLGDLYAWGLADGWWALVGWSVDGIVGGYRGAVHCSAWVPAHNVWPTGDPDPQIRSRTYQDVPRLALPAQRSAWPTVYLRGQVTCHHFGAVTADPGLPPELDLSR